jgi:putative hemolysin
VNSVCFHTYRIICDQRGWPNLRVIYCISAGGLSRLRMRRDAGTVGSGLPDSKVSYAVNIFVLSSFCDASMLSLACFGSLLVFLTA